MRYLSKYEILDKIGEGGISTVYRAKDQQSNAQYAIKIIKSQKVCQEIISSKRFYQTIQRFAREAKAIASLNHPNIVEIFEMGNNAETDEYYMVMEYLEGQSLAQLLQEKQNLEQEFVTAISIRVCDALAAAHSQNIIHRDIKPANIFYCQNQQLKIIDFGLARMEDELDLTEKGTILGSLSYMAPEQVTDIKNIDHRVDIYSLGVTMYRLLSGKYPQKFNNVTELIASTFEMTNYQPLDDQKVSKKLQNIVYKAMAKNRNKRFADMQEMKEALLSI